MKWNLKNQEHLKALDAYEDKGKHSEFLDERPTVYPTLIWIWVAFWKLSSSRQIGFGPGAISMSDMKAYLDMKRITNRQLVSDFVRYIQAMDAIWLESVMSKEGST